MTISEQFLNIANKNHHKEFCWILRGEDAKAISYGDLAGQSFKVAACLREHGSKAGEVVFIVLPFHEMLYSTFMGSILAGTIPSFMPPPFVRQNPEIYWNSHQKLFRRVGARFLITDGPTKIEIQKHMPTSELTIISIEDLPKTVTDTSFVTAAGDDIAFLQHSSGTTGLKKGVALSHKIVLTQLSDYSRSIQFHDTDRIASWLPLYHDMGLVTSFLLPLLTGASVASINPFEWVLKPEMLFGAIEKYSCTFSWLPNFSFNHLVRSVRADLDYDLSSLRALINCSEPCKPATFESFLSRFKTCGIRSEMLQTCYAMAENVYAVTQSEIDTNSPRACRIFSADRRSLLEKGRAQPSTTAADSIQFLSCGTPIPGVVIKIVDEQRKPTDPGNVGEIAISGESIFSGYYLLPEVTNAALHDGWYYTGDLGFIDQGELFITGRKNDLIIAQGKNLYAHDLEEVVSQIAGLKPGRCVAFGRHDSAIGTELVYVVAEAEQSESADISSLKRTIKERIFAHFDVMPRQVEVVSPGWLVKTTSGKISRELNAAKFFETMQRES